MKKPLSSLLLVAIILVSSVFVGGAFAAPNEKIPVIVGFKELPDAALIHAHGGEITYQYSIINAIACSLPAQAVNALQKNPKVAYVEEDIQVSAADIELDNSWGVKHIGAGTVHQSGNEGKGIKVAVLDTGINYNHEELIAVYKGGVDIINNDADPWDDNGHGTHCAGIIAAADNNNDVVVGVAPQVSLYSVKVLNSAGSGSISTIIAGLQWAVNNGMQVISMSLGASTGTTSLQQACDNAYNQGHGILIVAASGNDYRSTISYPAKYDSVIAVGATDSLDRRASFSNYGTGLELMAPGVYILSTYIDVSPNDNRNIDTMTMSGTSMATPHVAGVAALVFASPIDSAYDADHDGVWDASEVRAKLQGTADDLGTSGWDRYYGYGLVDADQAAAAPLADTTGPTITEQTPPNGATVYVAPIVISAKVTDTSGIDATTISMAVSGIEGSAVYSEATNLVTFTPSSTIADGIHTVTLSVKDSKGNLATTTWTFTVDTTPKLAHVESIGMALKTTRSNTYATATVTIYDANNKPLSGATVTGTWSGATEDTDTATTKTVGTVIVQSSNVRNAPPGTTFTFTVTGVTLAGYTFVPNSIDDTNTISK